MKDHNTEYSFLIRKISEHFSKLSQVDAIALGGSLVKGFTDKLSDIDLYVYSEELIPLEFRQDIVNKLGSSRTDLNLTFWDIGDEWIDLKTGIEVDIIYWNKTWIEEQIDRVLVKHEASVGYTTCFWHTVLNSTLLFDKNSWFEKLQKKCRQPYPEELRSSVISKNHPVLRNVIPSYYNQIEKAIKRNDLISINHRVAALLASYFDVLFALNYLPNPGEKKLLRFALENCEKIPEGLKLHLEIILGGGGLKPYNLPEKLTELIDNLDELLISEGIDPSNTLNLIHREG